MKLTEQILFNFLSLYTILSKVDVHFGRISNIHPLLIVYILYIPTDFSKEAIE